MNNTTVLVFYVHVAILYHVTMQYCYLCTGTGESVMNKVIVSEKKDALTVARTKTTS